MGIVQFSDGFESQKPNPAWFLTASAGFDYEKGNAHTGQGNAWVRATQGWNAINVWFSGLTPNSDCQASAWLRFSPSLTDGYISVRADGSGSPGPVIAELKLCGNAPPNPDNAGYNHYYFPFNSGSNSRVLFYVGLWGNGQDSWIQIDDVVLQCQTPF